MGNLVFQATLGGQVNLVGPNTASTFNLNVPATSSTIATLTGTETFTNKTLTSPTLTTPVLGTPSSGTLTNCTGLPNAGLVNSSVTVGSTAIALGATATTVAGLTSLATNTLTSAASTALTLQSAGTTAITVDASQNVGIGTTLPQTKFAVAGQIAFTSDGQGLNWNTYASGGDKYYGNGYAFLQYFDTSGNFRVFNATSNSSGAGAACTLTERMRIDSSGNLLVGTTSAISSLTERLAVKVASGTLTPISISVPSNANRYQIEFYTPSGLAGYVLTNTLTTSYTSVSDYRLKENITPMAGALARVSQLKPVTYKWKTDGSDGQGFIAHELAEVCSDAVTGIKDAVNEDGSIKPQGVDTSFLVATLTAAIQELKAINDTQAETINALTARIVALESK
jgi:hypothetical protein